ncbi:hypothetical protein [Lacrimispora sp.]|uniref:hypothetical protein n=1 Tax=Lacrimispora sp. TaxID=2719234 RepID=UPI0032E44442
MKRNEKLFIFISITIDVFLTFLLSRANMIGLLYIVLLFLVMVEFNMYRSFFVRVSNASYSQIEKLYRDKKNRYKGLYTYFSELCKELDVEDKFLIRTIKINNATDKLSIPFIAVMFTLFKLLYDNFEKILISFANIMCDLRNCEITESIHTMIKNSFGVFCFFTLFYLMFLFRSMVHSVAIKNYVNNVIEDVERDRCTYNSHGISNNEIIINSLERE